MTEANTVPVKKVVSFSVPQSASALLKPHAKTRSIENKKHNKYKADAIYKS